MVGQAFEPMIHGSWTRSFDKPVIQSCAQNVICIFLTSKELAHSDNLVNLIHISGFLFCAISVD